MNNTTRFTCTLLIACLFNAGTTEAGSNAHVRGNLDNCYFQFQTKKTGHVAFIGGSITEMNGYRPMVMEILTKRFPKTKFTFTDAGISSTCSTTGAFRLQNDVLSKGPVDLFFIEFAVNDDQDAGHARRECIRGMEGLIRHTRQHNPKADIVITHFVNPGMLAMVQAGKTPVSAGAHEDVAKHYNVSTINLQKELADHIAAGKMTWKQFGGTHPKPPGNRLCANMIKDLLTRAWDKPSTGTSNHETPEPIDNLHYGNGRFIDPTKAVVKSGWKHHVPDWKNLKGGKRGRFTKLKLLCATERDGELTLEFTGTAIGVYILAGPDAGIVDASIDGGDHKSIDTYHRFSRGLHYPRTVMFDNDLKPGKHKLTLRISKTNTDKGRGGAMRIIQFVAN
jgi:lysophospholipase L1-like esterase